MLANRARRPTRGLTEDWIRQHTAAEALENDHIAWLSDNEKNVLDGYSSLSSSEAEDPLEDYEFGEKTPTLKTFLERRDKSKRGGHHLRGPSAETIRPEDIKRSRGKGPESMTSTSSYQTAEQVAPGQSTDDVFTAREDTPPQDLDKPLPMPPIEAENEASSSSSWTAAALPMATQPALRTAAPKPAPSPAPEPRVKTKVPWGKKNIVIDFPVDDERGKPGKSPKPLTEKDVASMLKEWSQLGYNTAGFNLDFVEEDHDVASQGQSRGMWPEIADVVQERSARNFTVSIPDRSEWDAYVNELKEAKLRALGVSLGDEDPLPTPSPAPMLSRQASSQYPALPFGAPIPTSSAASSHGTQPSKLFSPPSMPGSTVSPASVHAHMLGKFHNPRQSISFSGNEHPFGSPYSQAQSPVPWSPQQMLYQGMHRGGSPSVNNFGGFSPNSPLPQDGYFPNDITSITQSRRQPSFAGQLPFQHQFSQPVSRQSPRLQELQIGEEPIIPDAAHVAQPTHRLNLSDSLQKEIEDAEYHLEEQFERQLDHDDYSPHSEKPQQSSIPPKHSGTQSGFAEPGTTVYVDKEGPVLHHPQPHSRGHSLSQRPYGEEGQGPELEAFANGNLDHVSEASTNPSALGTPKTLDLSSYQRSLSIATNPWTESESAPASATEPPAKRGHVSKASMSKLNVAAPEFKFNPGASLIASTFKPNPASTEFKFNPASTFTPGGKPFTFPQVDAQPVVPAFDTLIPISPPLRFGSGKINVNAPSFTPGQSEFSFSSPAPSFRPDAPEFTPQASYLSDSGASGLDEPSNLRSSIFGNINMKLSDTAKHTKKSKAIPIIRPDSSGNGRNVDDDVVLLGADGRITQGESRFKRSKAEKDDGDSVPLFAEPSMPLGETLREQSPPKEQTLIKPADKENTLASDKENEQLRVQPVSTAQTLQDQSRQRFEDSPDYEGKAWAPYEWQQQRDAADFSMAMAHSVTQAPFKVFEQPGASEETTNSASSTNSVKKHKKNSLSALAKPFTFGASWAEPPEDTPASTTTHVELVTGLSASDTMPVKSVKAAPTKVVKKGLASSRYADPSPSPEMQPAEAPVDDFSEPEESTLLDEVPEPATAKYDEHTDTESMPREQTFEEIDDVMRYMNEADTNVGAVRHSAEVPHWEASPERSLQMPNTDSLPIRLQPQTDMRSDAPSPSPRRFQQLSDGPAGQRVFSRVHDDPFINHSPIAQAFVSSPVHHLNDGQSVEPSDWDSVLDQEDELKFNARAQFFDSHVNEVVGGILAEKLDPMERVLQTIQVSLATLRPTSSKRDRRSISAELQESDADDEDDDDDEAHGQRRSVSPRRDRKVEKLRSIITEALAKQRPATPPTVKTEDTAEIIQALKELREQVSQSAQDRMIQISDEPESVVLRALKDLQEQFSKSLDAKPRSDELRDVVENALERRMPAAAEADVKIADLEARLAAMSEKTKLADEKVELEIASRRAAEDRVAEVERLLRISSAEEAQLRESLEEREKKLKNLEEMRAKNAMRSNLLEANSQNSQKKHSDLTNRIAVLEKDLVEARQAGRQWEFEAQKAGEIADKNKQDAEKSNAETTTLRRIVESLKLQMQESLRVRENFRVKLGSLQEDMAKAAQEVSRENAQRAKKEQALVARQEVLDARLQAEARTRERLEREIERLESGEREGIRAVNDSKKLDILVVNLESELDEAERNVLRYKREFEEARESGLSEVQRTRNYMQIEIDAANNQVNIVREELEEQVSRLRAEIDNVRLDADTARERHEMLLEEATDSKKEQLADLIKKHESDFDDLQTKHERQLGNAVEDAQRAEQHLLERLSLSSAKTEHLQDRVSHLEEKLEVATAAANAAAQAARTVKEAALSVAPPSSTKLPERVSPQALRESIMVLQEQLQNREQLIENLEQQLTLVDLDAPKKIEKRDDEITWLRELLAVRVGDLQDIINAASEEEFDADEVKAAAIRLKANLQMEEQERERAMNGGSAINLPNIANSIREAATPRVAQVVGPMAAAWGNWRKAREGSSGTPSRASPLNAASGAQNFLAGLMTPPASNLRQTPPHISAHGRGQQSAFHNTGRRLTAAQTATQTARERPSPRKEMNRAKGKARASSNVSASTVGALEPPSTPPSNMLRRESYDVDATQEDYSDAGFYDDDESTVDESMFGANLGR